LYHFIFYIKLAKTRFLNLIVALKLFQNTPNYFFPLGLSLIGFLKLDPFSTFIPGSNKKIGIFKSFDKP